jgi:hypothetical protein
MLDSWLSPTVPLLVLSWVVILRILSEEDYNDGLDPKSESAHVHIVGFSLGIILEQCTDFFCSRNRTAVQPPTIPTLPPYM